MKHMRCRKSNGTYLFCNFFCDTLIRQLSHSKYYRGKASAISAYIYKLEKSIFYLIYQNILLFHASLVRFEKTQFRNNIYCLFLAPPMSMAPPSATYFISIRHLTNASFLGFLFPYLATQSLSLNKSVPVFWSGVFFFNISSLF